jgi:hypothetical protein
MNNIEMIEFYLKQEGEKTLSKIKDCIDYLVPIITYKNYVQIYDSILNNDISREYKNLFHVEDDSNYIRDCLLESIKRIIDDMSYTEEIEDEIQTYKKDFQYYPDSKELGFIEQLTLKSELGIHAISSEIVKIEDKCNINFFELAPHQLFLKNLLSKNTSYNGLLIFHGVGVGKTCSGVSIAENFKDIYAEKDKRIIILASKNIQLGWKKTIFDPRKQSNQCTGDTYQLIEDNVTDINKQASKKIKTYYELYGYTAFANSIEKLLTESTKHISKEDEESIFKKEVQVIREKYSNRILIIDEVHNIRGADASKKESRNTIKYITKVIQYSQNFKLILLTANPMFNISTEIVWMLNMLLLNDNKTTISDKIFTEGGDLTSDGTKIVEEKCKGYISYLRGENPVSFPVRLYPTHDQEKIISSDNSPDIDIFGTEINDIDKLSFLKLYSSKLIGRENPSDLPLQKDVYLNEIQKYEGFETLQIQEDNKLLQMSNIVYPCDEIDSEKTYGEGGLLNCFSKKIKGKSPQFTYLTDESFLDKDLIGEYSSKIKSILEIVEKSEGIVFIYTNWISAGILPLVLALEQNGYAKYDGSEILNTDDKREPISYTPYETDEEFIQAKYIVIAGTQENLTHNLKEELEVLTDEKNIKGKLIKVIIGSKVASEGLDFKCVRAIHVLEPWHNINKLEQVVGRGIRNCSHTLLTSEERNVTIYLHNSFLDDDNETIDTYLYRYSEKKAKQIGKIENILKKNAIDKYLFQHVNYLSKTDVESFKIKPCYKDSDKYLYTPDDKDGSYSRVCSFQNKCNYLENDSMEIDESKFNNDTFNIKYSQGLTDVYKKRISLLFKETQCFTYEELIESLMEYKKIDERFLTYALDQMINDKYMITYHNNNGYLIYIHNLFVFQPYFNSDKLLPYYYRNHKGISKKSQLFITSKEERKNKIINERISYSLDSDGPIQILYNDIKNKYNNIHSNEEKIMNYLSIEDSIKYEYYIDRLPFNQRKILLYSLLYSIKEDKIIDKEFQDVLVSILQPTFIYYNEDTGKFEYHSVYHEKNKMKLSGGFLYHHHNKEPIFYKYESGHITLLNKMDIIYLQPILKKQKKNKTIDFSKSWGYTTFSSRYKNRDNGIVMKFVTDDSKTKSYPPGPGKICRDSNNNKGATSKETFTFIRKDKELYHLFTENGKKNKDYMSKLEDYNRSKSKIEYSIFIELCFRKLNRFIQTDLIWLQYY